MLRITRNRCCGLLNGGSGKKSDVAEAMRKMQSLVTRPDEMAIFAFSPDASEHEQMLM